MHLLTFRLFFTWTSKKRAFFSTQVTQKDQQINWCAPRSKITNNWSWIAAKPDYTHTRLVVLPYAFLSLLYFYFGSWVYGGVPIYWRARKGPLRTCCQTIKVHNTETRSIMDWHNNYWNIKVCILKKKTENCSQS